MHRSRRSSTSSDSDYGAPIRITKTQVLPVSRSHGGRHRHHSPDTVVVNANNYLQLPGQRARASSTSGQPVPVINNYYTDDRKRSHSHHRGRRDSSGSSHHRSRSQRRYYDDLPPDLLVDLALNDRETEQRKRDKAIKDALREAKYKEEEEKEERQRIILEAKLKEEADKKKAEEKEKEIVAAWKQKEREEKEKKEAEKKEFDEKYESRVRMDFLAAGYSESTIDSIIKKKKDKEAQNRLAIEKARPTFIRVHTRYLDTRTLVHYDLPWEYDRENPDYIIIKKYISHEFQEDLFEHTNSLKSRKLLEGPKARRRSGEIDLIVPGTNMYVVKKTRSKSPSRGYFIRRKD